MYGMKDILYFADVDSIVQSIAAVTGVTQNQIWAFSESLRGIKLPEPIADTVWRQFRSEYQIEPRIEDTCYFHGTRLHSLVDYEVGLLPNHLAIDKTWINLWRILKNNLPFTSHQEFRTWFEADAEDHSPGYFTRISCADFIRQRGPWGKLMRHEWWQAGSRSNHYVLNGPEIVSLIMIYVEKRFCIPAKEQYLAQTKPCIIHFLSGRSDPTAIGYGLLYLKDMPLMESPCFDVGAQRYRSVPRTARPL
jgi:hypothetical protein